MDCPVTAEGHCVSHEANMQTIEDLKEDRKSRIKTVIVLVGTIGPLLAAAIGYGISVSNKVTAVDVRVTAISDDLGGLRTEIGNWTRMQMEVKTRQEDVLRRLDKIESRR